MCSIAGILRFDGKSVDENLIHEMNQTMSHRGPDETGSYFNQNIGLGHNRLKIVDLSDKAHQPFVHRSQRYALVFNGEIYNYRELKLEMAARGVSFDSSSDTEVLLEGLILEGKDFLSKVNGDFAFAFWDRQNSELLIARDRFGVKPVYYSMDKERIIFGSEPKGILKVQGKAQLNLQAFASFLQLRYNIHEESFFKGIYKLPPASIMVVRDGKTQISKYWQLVPKPQKTNFEDLDHNFERACRLRFTADVETSALLSGGIDSSYIASTMGAGEKVFTYHMEHSPDAQWATELSHQRRLNQVLINGDGEANSLL
jgi:asparagine synthase (glutamine-hydrolysing)